MAEEIIEEKKEEELSRKIKSKRRVRGLLIAINVLLTGYLVFEIVSKIVDNVSNRIEDSDIITLNGSSRKDSLALYNRYVAKNEDGSYDVEEVFDYGIYGDYLHLSKSSYEIGRYSSFESVSLINVSSKKFDSSEIIKVIEKEYLNGGIRLTNLDVGDYLVFPGIINISEKDRPHRAIKIRSYEGINKVIYSLPNESGHRKKIQVKSKDSSPSLVISVSEVGKLPNNYYDMVLIGTQSDSYREKVDSSLSCFIANTLEEAFLAKANYCLVVDSIYQDAIVSNYYKCEENIVHDDLYGKDSIISLQDENVYIRELGGYLTSSGSGISSDNNTLITRPYLEKNTIGKIVLLCNENIDYKLIKNVLKI